MADLAFLHGGNIYEAKRKYKKNVTDFSANINPLGLPSWIKKTIYKNFDKILHYPDPEAKDLTQTLAKYWNIKKENVLVGNGSVEFIYLIISIYMPKTVLIPLPTFSDYERSAKCIKSRIQYLNLEIKKGFKPDLSRLRYADILFLCNPNNPTGNLIIENPKIVEKLASKLVIIDEAFMDFLPDEKDYTLIWKAIKNKRIIVLRTFTKFFALPGLRMGYVIAHKEIINKLKHHQPPWSTNSLAQLSAKLILNDKGYIRKTRKLIEKERNFLSEQLAQIRSLRFYPSVTNFLLVKIEDKNLTSFVLTKRLIRKGILVRDCSNFRGLNNKFIRIALRSRKENQKLLNTLKEVI